METARVACYRAPARTRSTVLALVCLLGSACSQGNPEALGSESGTSSQAAGGHTAAAKSTAPTGGAGGGEPGKGAAAGASAAGACQGGTCAEATEPAAGGGGHNAADERDADAGASEPPAETATPSTTAQIWFATRPRPLGKLVGFGASYADEAEVYGSDMAFSFTHAGKVVMLFGDTYGTPDAACDTTFGDNDDMVGTLPQEFDGEMPKLEVLTEPGSSKFRRVQLLNQGSSVVLDEFKVPIAGFSDGHDAYALFQAQVPVTCDANAPGEQRGCPQQDGVQCVPNLSFCKPAPISVPATCEPQQPVCLLGGCTKQAACVDTRSSEYDGSPRGNAASIMSEVYIGKARGGDLSVYDVVATWQTNVFSHPSVRTVAHFSGQTGGSDYGRGSGELLIWGRPSMLGEQGRQSHLYFARAALPLTTPDGALRPRYYAGSDEQSGEPRWSDDPASAVALAMDGQLNGDPDDQQAIVTMTTVSWLAEPINQWVMLYGGDLPPNLLADPNGTRAAPNTGAIVIRFAQHPWGPWSPAVVHLPAGSPQLVGDAYGPGGILFHPDCKDQPQAACAQPDPYSLDITGQCVMRPARDLGRLYAPAIVDAYTRKNTSGGLDLIWAISTWAPYAAFLMQSSINPG